MFRKQQREAFSYIHEDTEIHGDLVVRGRLRIHGKVFGNIAIEGVLEVAATGLVEGEYIQADEVKILGHVRADVRASGTIEIWKEGVLEGDVVAASLDIEQGARFSGRSEMKAMETLALDEHVPFEISEDF